MSVKTYDEEPFAAILDAATTHTRFALSRATWGFGGVHGGLALAMLTRAMRAKASGQALRRVEGHFRRSLRGEFEIDVREDHAGASVRWLSARAQEGESTCLSATAVFATSGDAKTTPVAAAIPDAPPPASCPLLTVPRELVASAWRTEIRPVGIARPYARGDRAELLAWLRITEDDVPPNEERTVLLMDSLAPSYAVLLDAPAPIPTLTFSVTLGGNLARASSPWLLLRARTDLGSDDGWLHENLDAWTPEGAHVAAAAQLRVVRPARSPGERSPKT